MKLILVRHGETEENRSKIVQGHMPGTLSKDGVEQAKKLANRLKDEPFDFVYSSDLKRAADTAAEILKFHPDVPVEYTKLLRERDAKAHTGQFREDHTNLPDVETDESMIKRGKEFLDLAYAKHPKGTILVVGHNRINRAMTTVIMNKPASYMSELKKGPNTGVSIFEIAEDGNHKVRLLNCAKHLES